MHVNSLSIFGLVGGYLGLPFLFCEEDHGVTRMSLDAVREGHPRPALGSVDRVYLYYQAEPDWHFYTILVNSFGAYVYTGFAWGYGGEGPRGLEEVLKRFAFEVPENMPQPHVPGLWRIDRGNPLVQECTL